MAAARPPGGTAGLFLMPVQPRRAGRCPFELGLHGFKGALAAYPVGCRLQTGEILCRWASPSSAVP